MTIPSTDTQKEAFRLTPKQIELLERLCASSMGGHRNKLTASENANGTRLWRKGLLIQKFVAYSGQYLFITDAGRAWLQSYSSARSQGDRAITQ